MSSDENGQGRGRSSGTGGGLDGAAGQPTSDAPLMPKDAGQPILKPLPESAAGLAAVISALAYNIKHAGVARTRALFRLNQQGGFDCPSCAWPDPKHRSMTEFCENGARAVGDEATTARVDAAFFAEHTVADLLARSDHWLNSQGRLTEPMVRLPGAPGYTPISWADAFALVADSLNSLGSPNEAVFYTSGRTSNEAAFLYQLFARQFGTNNLPDCSNMCHESSGYGLSQTIGIGKGTVTLEDFERAQVIVVIGQNPGTNHPRMLAALQEAKRKGATILSINPLKEVGLVRFKHPQELSGVMGGGTILADLHLRVRVGGDMALLLAIQKLLVEAGSIDADYIAERTVGFEDLRRYLEVLELQPLADSCGVPLEELQQAAAILGTSQATIVCWAMGITQHENGVANVQAIVNLLLLGGHFGRPGAGACPVRGHSNVQGDRTMGIWEYLPPWGPQLGQVCDFAPPQNAGWDVVATIEALRAGHARVFFAMGGNFLSATPDSERVAEGLARTRLSVHVSTKLNRSHLVTGETALILPCLGRTEADLQAGQPQFVSVENSMGIVSMSEGRLPPAAATLLSEVQIVAQLAQATLGSRSQVPWADLAANYDGIRDLIAAVVPGFADYNQRVRQPNGFALPNPVREGGFATPSGKGHFSVHAPPELDLPPGHFWLTTIRSHDQFNTTIYDMNDRYRGVYGHRYVVFMAPDDVQAQGLRAGARVQLTSHFRGEERVLTGFVIVPYDIPSGNIAAYFPEANPLVPVGSFAVHSRTPTSKRIQVSVSALPEA